MKGFKKCFVLFLCISLVFLIALVGCNTENDKEQNNSEEQNMEFKLDDNYVPIPTFIYLNDKTFEIKDGYSWNQKSSFDLKVNLNDLDINKQNLTVFLPPKNVVCTWIPYETSEGLKFKEEDAIRPSSKTNHKELEEDVRDGEDGSLQKFTFEIIDKSQNNEIIFKWINVNELLDDRGTSYKDYEDVEDIEEYYKLRIILK